MCRPLRLRVAEVKSCRPAFIAETQRFRRGRGEQRQRGLLCVFSASPCLCGLPPCRNFTTRSGQKETAVARRRRVLGCLGRGHMSQVLKDLRYPVPEENRHSLLRRLTSSQGVNLPSRKPASERSF